MNARNVHSKSSRVSGSRCASNHSAPRTFSLPDWRLRWVWIPICLMTVFIGVVDGIPASSIFVASFAAMAASAWAASYRPLRRLSQDSTTHFCGEATKIGFSFKAKLFKCCSSVSIRCDLNLMFAIFVSYSTERWRLSSFWHLESNDEQWPRLPTFEAMEFFPPFMQFCFS